MEPTIFKYIFRYSMRQQIYLLIVTAVSLPFLYYSLDLPKTIINEAIDAAGKDFPKSIFGIELLQIEYLLVLCAVFLTLVLINGGFKYWINVYKGQLGERMLRRLRYLLYSRVLRFPLPHFRKASQGGIIAMITAEVEPLGGFIGDAVALPAFQGGTLLTILAFMFVQDPILGTAAVILYPLQMYLIPKMQKHVNDLAKQRVRAVRGLSERIGESVSGMQEIHAHDTSELELADFSKRLGAIFTIRYDIYRRKFLIKFLNNFIANVTPFFFYSIGGYLVIEDDLTFGSLVAVIAAYKDLAAPWKELLRYYQQMEDSRIKYEQLVEQFQPMGMLEEDLQRVEPEPAPSLAGAVVATNLTLEEEGGIKVVDGATFKFEVGESVAVVGPNGSGKAALAQLIARLVMPDGGSIRVGDHNLAGLPEAVTGRRMAYVGQNAYLFSGSVRDNLFYGLKHRPLKEPGYDGEAQGKRSLFVKEADASGNTASDIEADWVDFQAADVSGPSELVERAFQVLDSVGLKKDIYELGLQGCVDPTEAPDLTGRIFEARMALRQRLKEPDFAKLVEPFDRERYNSNMSVAENLLFGTLIGSGLDIERLGEHPYVLSTLDRVGLYEDFLGIGFKLAEVMVELFQDLPPDHEYFERFSFISAEELPDYQHFLLRAEAEGSKQIEKADRDMLISLPFKMIPARHRLGVIDEAVQKRILEARRLFAQDLPDDLKGSVAFFDQDKYNAQASIQDNILFGKLVYGRHQSWPRVGRLIEDVIRSLGLYEAVLEVGLDSQVGIGGGRLSVAQRQRLAIARCLIKRPDILIVNAAAAALDPASQAEIVDNVFKESEGRGLVWILNRPELAERFDGALVMDGGKVVEHGRFEDLNRPGKLFHSLLNGS